MKKILFFTFFVISFSQLVLPSFATLEGANEDDRSSSYISIKGLQPIKVIEALWNNAIGTPKHRQNQQSYVTTSTESFPQEEVIKKLNVGTWTDYLLGGPYFDCLSSRPLNVFLCGESFHSYMYNENHGDGRAEKVIRRLRETGFTDLLPEDGRACDRALIIDLQLESMFSSNSSGVSMIDIYNDLRTRIDKTRERQ